VTAPEADRPPTAPPVAVPGVVSVDTGIADRSGTGTGIGTHMTAAITTRAGDPSAGTAASPTAPAAPSAVPAAAPGAASRWLDAHPLAVDVVVAVAAAAVALLGGVTKDGPLHLALTAPLAWYALWAIAHAALVLRRRRPVAVTSVALAAALLQAAVGGTVTPWAVLVGLYSIAAHRGTSWGWWSAAVITYVEGARVVLIGAPLATVAGDGAVVGLGTAVVVLVALNLRGRRAYFASLVDRAAQLERERAQEARLAAGEERARIARELHDVVAHGMSVMISLADGADAIADIDSEGSRRAVRQIAAVGRDALGDMRLLLGVLRNEDDGPEFAPQPGLGRLDELAATYRAAGLPVAITRRGELAQSSARETVVYRAVQEGLTNALRYAVAPTRVLVDLQGDGRGGIVAAVVDDGRTTTAGASHGSERGLVGLRERAVLFDGSVAAGPREELGGRGWRLVLTLPGAGEGDR
jgi:signal transduction histidine kinase